MMINQVKGSHSKMNSKQNNINLIKTDFKMKNHNNDDDKEEEIEESSNQIQMADFIRDVELSAKKLLRDDHHQHHHYNHQQQRQKRNEDSSCNNYNNTNKHPIPKAVNDDNQKHKEHQQLTYKDLHHKLKGSPFYEAWEEWNKSKMKKNIENTIAGAATATTSSSTGMYTNKNMMQKGIYNGRMKSASSRSSSCQKENTKRFEMKEHLTSNSLRKRFRCDQNLILDERHERCKATSSKSGGDGSSSGISSKTCHDKEEDSKKELIQLEQKQKQQQKQHQQPMEEDQDQNDNVISTSYPHPLEESLFNHVDIITTRIKTMTHKRIESTPRIKDVQSCWDLNKKGLPSCDKSKASRGLKLSVIDNEGDDCDRSSELLGDNCQLQSVPLHIATQSFVKHVAKVKESEESSIAASTIKPVQDDEPIVERNKSDDNDNESDSSSPLKIPPECWALAVVEDILNGELKLSIHLMRSRKTPTLDSPSEEKVDFEDNFQYWIVDVHNKSFHQVKTFVFLDEEVESLIENFDAPPTSASEEKEQRCVHTQQVSKDVGGTKLCGLYTVNISTNEKNEIGATISIEFDDIESRYGMTRNTPIKFSCPVYEIVARLRLLHVCKASDHNLWFSRKNGRMIWEPLFERLQIDVVRDEVIHGDQVLSFSVGWPRIKRDQAEIKWLQPSVEESNQYFSALKKAYDLIHLFGASSLCKSFISDLEVLSKDQTWRRDFITKKRIELRQLLPPKSLRLLGPLAITKTLIPGACTIGEKGIGFALSEIPSDRSEAISFKRESELDLTQAVAQFQRYESKKGTPFNKVTMLLALERPFLTPSLHAWDPNQVTPKSNEGEPQSNMISTVMAEGISIRKEPLQSVIDTWIPPSIILCDDPSSLDNPKWKIENFHDANEIFQTNGFRLKCQAHEIHYDDTIQSKGYGISERALSPNQTGVNCRSHWSSKEYCTKLLSKERGSDDFFHLLQNEFSDRDGGLPSQPLISIIHMKAYDLKCVKGIKMDRYLYAKEKRNQLRKLEAEKRSLSEKIAKADRLVTRRVYEQLKAEEKYYFDSKFEHPEDDNHIDQNSTAAFSECPPVEIVPLNDEISQANTQLRGYGWRKLPKSTLGVDFFELNKRKIQTYSQGSLFHKCNNVRLIGKVNAKESIDYQLDDELFVIKLETKFIQDVLIDRMEVSKANENQHIVQEKILTSNQQEALEHILNVPLTKPTTIIEDVVEHHTGDDMSHFVKKEHEMEEDQLVENSNYMHHKRERENEDSKLLLAVKHSNYDVLKDLIDRNGMEVDTYDEFGNTLFILACQQGNKKLCKFLLRRGAYINAQNHTGNTGLHYLFEYGHSELAEYIRGKGADDTYLNAEGLTCFEGVHRKNLEAL